MLLIEQCLLKLLSISFSSSNMAQRVNDETRYHEMDNGDKYQWSIEDESYDTLLLQSAPSIRPHSSRYLVLVFAILNTISMASIYVLLSRQIHSNTFPTPFPQREYDSIEIYLKILALICYHLSWIRNPQLPCFTRAETHWLRGAMAWRNCSSRRMGFAY
jgi:hypothetical protein